jgi:hypothetical protein
LIEKQSQQQNPQNDRNTFQRSIQNRFLLRLNELDPLVVNSVEFLFVIDALIEARQLLLSRRAILRRVDDRIRVVVAPRQARSGGQRSAICAQAGL